MLRDVDRLAELDPPFRGSGTRPSGPSHGKVGVIGTNGAPLARASESRDLRVDSSEPTTATGTIGEPALSATSTKPPRPKRCSGSARERLAIPSRPRGRPSLARPARAGRSRSAGWPGGRRPAIRAERNGRWKTAFCTMRSAVAAAGDRGGTVVHHHRAVVGAGGAGVVGDQERAAGGGHVLDALGLDPEPYFE